jgi:hypothetical protein
VSHHHLSFLPGLFLRFHSSGVCQVHWVLRGPVHKVLGWSRHQDHQRVLGLGMMASLSWTKRSGNF